MCHKMFAELGDKSDQIYSFPCLYFCLFAFVCDLQDLSVCSENASAMKSLQTDSVVF